MKVSIEKEMITPKQLDRLRSDIKAIYGRHWILGFLKRGKDVSELTFKKSIEIRRVAKMQ